MYEEPHKYVYDGPVMEFDNIVARNWHGETSAVSAAKARCNLAYQFKKQTNRVPKTRITLPGTVRLVN